MSQSCLIQLVNTPRLHRMVAAVVSGALRYRRASTMSATMRPPRELRQSLQVVSCVICSRRQLTPRSKMVYGLYPPAGFDVWLAGLPRRVQSDPLPKIRHFSFAFRRTSTVRSSIRLDVMHDEVTVNPFGSCRKMPQRAGSHIGMFTYPNRCAAAYVMCCKNWSQVQLTCYFLRRHRAEALSEDARLTSVAYIGRKSRTERPRKTKIGTEVAHVTRTPFSRSKVKGQLAGLPHSLLLLLSGLKVRTHWKVVTVERNAWHH